MSTNMGKLALARENDYPFRLENVGGQNETRYFLLRNIPAEATDPDSAMILRLQTVTAYSWTVFFNLALLAGVAAVVFWWLASRCG